MTLLPGSSGNTPAEQPSELSDEYLIANLAHRPLHQLAGRILISNPAKFSALPPCEGPSSMGYLDCLPLEILQVILNLLDFQALSRLSCTSHRARRAVEYLPAYRELMEHAPDTLTALGKSCLITAHSAAKLRAVLRTESCVWCGEYGPFLFLPTCERCCYECQRSNPSLWVMTADLAKYCFNITAAKLREIPIMRSIYGVYDVSHELSRRRRLKLVSVRAAKELSLTANASSPAAAPLNQRNNRHLAHFQNAPLAPEGQSNGPGVTSRIRYSSQTDECCGMGSICFPSLQPDDTVERGLWCRGCFRASEQYRFSSPCTDLATRNVYPLRALIGTNLCARSKMQFLEHIKHCDGSLELQANLRRGLQN
ncbi:F-box domain-containing protein [Trichophyton interdigitale]|uniref:F-box domain-containing protein n=1 Tax=Trichophyton interdigitale TaxID=101480 RepID=A0A9P4YJL4_9EURO|nr:F-box domain-containing protein [Trichophyton interdigitale]KAF3897137.1 F-box domain-containing protein [Trichophyton interdigitale]KAG8207680.1 F-box domain-containing protein [Trichophyton interdigitale]